MTKRIVRINGCGQCPYNGGWDPMDCEFNSDPNYEPIEDDYISIFTPTGIDWQKVNERSGAYSGYPIMETLTKELYLEQLTCAYHRMTKGTSELYGGGMDFPIGCFVRYRYKQSLVGKWASDELLDVPIPDWCPLENESELEILKELESIYHEQCRQAGYPCDYIVNPSLEHAIRTLRHALGADLSDVDPTCLVSFKTFEDLMKKGG